MTNIVAILAFITIFEGYSPTEYLDSLGNRTIGVGLNVSDPAIAALVEQHGTNKTFQILATEAALDVQQLIPELQGVAQITLIDMRFQMGPSRFRGFKQMILAANNKDFAGMALEMKNSKWYGQSGQRSKHHYLLIKNLTPSN